VVDYWQRVGRGGALLILLRTKSQSPVGTISGVAAVYQRHQFLAKRREALDRCGDHIACMLGETGGGLRGKKYVESNDALKGSN
jgi:hypothetical protein